MGDGVVVAKQKRMRVTSLLCFFKNKKYQKTNKFVFVVGGLNFLGSISMDSMVQCVQIHMYHAFISGKESDLPCYPFS